MTVGDKVEIITPNEMFEASVEKILDENMAELDVANTNAEVWIKFSSKPVDYRYAIARTVGIKNVQEGCGDCLKCL